jgi:hypothetical protein
MKKDNTILLLLAAFGIYWFYFRKKSPMDMVSIPSGEITNVPPATPYTPLTGGVVLPDSGSMQETPEFRAKFVLNGYGKGDITRKLGKVPNTI